MYSLRKYKPCGWNWGKNLKWHCVYVSVCTPVDSNIETLMYELNIVECLYNNNRTHGDVIIAGDLNSSHISSYHENTSKAKCLTAFITRYNVCKPSVNFDVEAKQHTFISKCTLLDYIPLTKALQTNVLSTLISKRASCQIHQTTSQCLQNSNLSAHASYWITQTSCKWNNKTLNFWMWKYRMHYVFILRKTKIKNVITEYLMNIIELLYH